MDESAYPGRRDGAGRQGNDLDQERGELTCWHRVIGILPEVR